MLVNNCTVTLMCFFKIMGSRAVLAAQRVVDRTGPFLGLRRIWREVRQRDTRRPHLQHPQPSLSPPKACKPEWTPSACSLQNVLWRFPFPCSLSTDFSESSCIFSTLLHLLSFGQKPLICNNKIVWWPEYSAFSSEFSSFEYQHSILLTLEKSWSGCGWNFILGYCNDTKRAAIIQISNESRPSSV